jgi:hypothetical protein
MFVHDAVNVIDPGETIEVEGDALREQLGVGGGGVPPPVQSSVLPFTTQPPEGSEMLVMVCACTPYPRVRPSAADAAHNQVRKRIMNLSLPLTSPG